MKPVKSSNKRILAIIAIGIIACAGSLYAGGIKGSIKARDNGDYYKFVKLDIPAAAKTVETKYPKARIKSVRLQEEDGYLVYEVLFMNSGKKTDAKVDAGNGKILKTDTAENNERGEKMNKEGDGEENDSGVFGWFKKKFSDKGTDEKDNEVGKNSPKYKSSVSAKNSDESQMLSAAKIGIASAVKKALAKFPGKAVKAVLENENDNLVYGVEIISAEGGADVKIDAGNGNIMAVEKDGGSEKDEND